MLYLHTQVIFIMSKVGLFKENSNIFLLSQIFTYIKRLIVIVFWSLNSDEHFLYVYQSKFVVINTFILLKMSRRIIQGIKYVYTRDCVTVWWAQRDSCSFLTSVLSLSLIFINGELPVKSNRHLFKSSHFRNKTQEGQQNMLGLSFQNV